MKKFVLVLILMISILTGCYEEKTVYDLTFKEYNRTEDRFIVTFENSDNEEINFTTSELSKISWLEEGKKYKVTYDYSDQEMHYQINYIELYNKSLEDEE